MAKTLVAHEQAIQKVFSDDYVFRIPDFQRPCSWTQEQAGELIEDLVSFIQANPGPVADMPTYFLGSIVLIKGDALEADVVEDSKDASLEFRVGGFWWVYSRGQGRAQPGEAHP